MGIGWKGGSAVRWHAGDGRGHYDDMLKAEELRDNM